MPTTFIDILYNHRRYLEMHQGLLAKAGCLQGKNIAIVGAGPSGLLAAYQLVSLGANVDLYESSPHYGGRIRSLHPIKDDAAIFEMGAMRVPPSEQLFGFYADHLGMQSETFPDPGKVPTQLIYNNQVHDWKPNQPLPDIFHKISHDWQEYVNRVLIPIKALLAEGSEESYYEAARQWQSLIFGSEHLLTIVN